MTEPTSDPATAAGDGSETAADERTRGTEADDPASVADGPSTDADGSASAAYEPSSVADLLPGTEGGLDGYNYAYLDEHTKREVRRGILKAVALPGHQVPFASREMPLARGWGTGGIQASLSLLGPDDAFKVIDQGSDESVNAANVRRLAERTADVDVTTDTAEATVIQTRHRIPEEVMTDEQILVLQVPTTDPLRRVDGSDDANRRRHAHRNYSKMWVALYENVVEWGEIQIPARYPVLVDDRYLMDPSPIPRWDTTKLNDAETLFLFAAGREARVYAVPPHTSVEPLAFEDRRFQVERFAGESCHRCGSTDTYLTEVTDDDGVTRHACNDASFCEKRVETPGLPKDHHLDADGVAWGPGTPDPLLTDDGGDGA
ncbi:alpha-D-ribose 1-methylphosphonate 5-phosphate C-P-lyase PhnJ [Halomarina pelagica]|uniref:alpha-D-ribose 1-methylphosphonate 5-phosphate C-P-lyase PhnJ n=1 Tax=Halomarina pelagica TaxID=2961599 RepID=UPI0021151850|nr:alpha-D-ribose 1-methylphosphonate 5-phosphate C-P-lyase PhnJ [Halomarina sp. BND7]